jgi:hypothetical protein
MSDDQDQPIRRRGRPRRDSLPIIGDVSDRRTSMLVRMPSNYKSVLKEVALKEDTTLNGVFVKALNCYFSQTK